VTFSPCKQNPLAFLVLAIFVAVCRTESWPQYQTIALAHQQQAALRDANDSQAAATFSYAYLDLLSLADPEYATRPRIGSDEYKPINVQRFHCKP